MINFPYDLLQKVMKLVPLTATVNEVYVATTPTVISDYYSSLEETLNHLNCLKLKNFPGENVAELCDAILVYDDRLESAEYFSLNHLGYITQIFLE